MIKGSNRYYRYESLNVENEQGLRQYFIESLNIDRIIQELFSFHLRRTTDVALGLISGLEMDPEIIRKRQEAVAYYLGSDDLEEKSKEFSSLLRQQEGLGRIEIRNEHEGRCIPSSINALYLGYKNLVGAIEGLGRKAKNTPIEEICQETEKHKAIYKELAPEFPLHVPEHLCDIDYETDDRIFNLAVTLRVSASKLDSIFTTLDYFISMAQGFRGLQERGANIVFPDIVNPRDKSTGSLLLPDHLLPSGFRICHIVDGVNPVLYIGENADKIKVPNEFYIDEVQPIRLCTGENEYGKTMYLKTRGVKQAFFQAGLPIIATSARMTPVNAIFANVGLTEDTERAKSTYANINTATFNMIRFANSRSLLLLDEPTAGTYAIKAETQSAIYLEEIARGGYEAIVVTHHLGLTKLAEKYHQIINLTTQVDEKGDQTYRMVEGVFQPSSTTMKLEYPRKEVERAIPESHEQRLRRILKKNMPDSERQRIYEAFPQLRE